MKLNAKQTTFFCITLKPAFQGGGGVKFGTFSEEKVVKFHNGPTKIVKFATF